MTEIRALFAESYYNLNYGLKELSKKSFLPEDGLKDRVILNKIAHIPIYIQEFRQKLYYIHQKSISECHFNEKSENVITKIVENEKPTQNDQKLKDGINSKYSDSAELEYKNFTNNSEFPSDNNYVRKKK
ncbi:hypothetical protein HZS_6209 [Henneguya salminicola]|nr:hypothetical protein HZS_6209 [Henneguya salminicola]